MPLVKRARSVRADAPTSSITPMPGVCTSCQHLSCHEQFTLQQEALREQHCQHVASNGPRDAESHGGAQEKH